MQQPPHPFGYGPYAPPEATGTRPSVIMWFRVYAAMCTLLYVGMLVFFGLFMPSMTSNAHTTADSNAIGTLFFIGVIVLLCGGFFGLSTFVPFKPWGWTVGLVAICLGLSGCFAVVSIPLFIYWIKPETKAAFGRL